WRSPPGKRGRESETAACERLPLLCQLCARTSRQEARLPVRTGFLGSREFGMRDIRAWKVARLDKPTNAASAGPAPSRQASQGFPDGAASSCAKAANSSALRSDTTQ